MKDKDRLLYIKEGIVYFLGAVLTALGLVMLLRSDLGMPPWDILHLAIAEVTPLTFGMAIQAVSIIITAFIVFYRKKTKYLFMIVPFLLVGWLIDLFNLYIFAGLTPDGYARLFFFFLGLGLLPLGSVLLIISIFPAGIYDELMLVLMRIFKTRKIALVRVIMEATPVLLGLIITLSLRGTTGSFYYGTFIIVVLAGPLIQLYIKFIRRHADAH